jgi:S-adenosyl-L-methionine hydrolase (adenosine-forming)
MSSPVVTFLSDYGLADDFVGVCHGVIARICPDARIIDITHGIPRHDARAGAIVLAGALPYTPVGVHLAVVDPDVGASRRAIAVRLGDGRLLVGPDNGLLSLAADAGGGIVEAVDIAQSRLRLEPVSATFHGRDIFAPVAAQLAAGVALGEAGSPLDPDSLVRLELPRPHVEPSGRIVAHAIYVDRYGNVQLDVTHDDLAASRLKLGHGARLRLPDGRTETAQFVRTFADAPEAARPILYEDGYRRLALAVSHGDAAGQLGLAVGDELRIEPT